MKRVEIFLAVLCAAVYLCACQEAPREVEENMKKYGDNPQLESSEITYCSVDEMKQAKLPEITGSNLSFPEYIDFSEIEGVEILQLSLEKDFLNEGNVKKYMELFEGNLNEIKSRKKSDEMGFGGAIIEYENEEEQKYISILENGGMVHMAGLSYTYFPNKIEHKYQIDKEDISNVNVLLRDKEVNLDELCKSTEEWMQENFPIKGIQYKISDAFVRKMDDTDARKVSMCAEYEYKGIRLDDHTMPQMEEKWDLSTECVTTNLVVQMEYDAANIPSYFSRNEGFVIDSTEKVEKVVDFESAVKIVNETLSGFGTFEITEVCPLYALYVEGDSNMPGARINARPVYAFLVQAPGEEPGMGILKFGTCKNFFLVDMVTGELVTDSDIGRSG